MLPFHFHPHQDAVSDAYDRTLAQIHAWVVRAGIKTGMMALPSRDHFLASIGETGGPGGRGRGDSWGLLLFDDRRRVGRWHAQW